MAKLCMLQETTDYYRYCAFLFWHFVLLDCSLKLFSFGRVAARSYIVGNPETYTGSKKSFFNMEQKVTHINGIPIDQHRKLEEASVKAGEFVRGLCADSEEGWTVGSAFKQIVIPKETHIPLFFWDQMDRIYPHLEFFSRRERLELDEHHSPLPTDLVLLIRKR